MLCRHVRLLSGLIEYYFEYFRDIYVALAAPATCLLFAVHLPPATFLMTRATACLAPRFVLFIVVAATATATATATVIYTCCLFYANLMQHSYTLAHTHTHTHSLTHTLPQGKENKRAAI